MYKTFGCNAVRYRWERSPIAQMIIIGGAAAPKNVSKPSKSTGRLHTAMVRLPQDFKEFLKLFNDEQVQYLLIGGYAVGLYGYPRTTAALDIRVAIQPDNANKIVSALSQFGMDANELSTDLFLCENRIVRMGMPPIRIEIHTGISGVEFNTCYARRKCTELDGVPVNLIALEDLKANKRASGRHRDLDDIDHLP